MGIVVNTNVASLMVQRNLSKAVSGVKTSMQRLSTGMRINTAGDDAAGLALSEKLKAQVSASDVNKNNAQTGINMLNIADGDFAIIQQNLQRIRDLAVQSANGVYSTSERKSLDLEVQSRMQEITRVAKSSTFSEMNLLDGSLSGKSILLQIGANSETSTNTIDISGAFLKATCSALGVATSSSITTVSAARTMITSIDAAIAKVSDRRSLIGASVNRLTSTVDRIDTRKENLQASNSIIRDTDIAAETSSLTKNQILQQAAATLLQQANNTPSLALTLL